MQLRVALNGTNENPWIKYGLTQNPFPQTAKMEHDDACLRLQALSGEPIKNMDQIRKQLDGYFSPEFIELCCEKFAPGYMIKFLVEWKDD